MDIKRRYLFIIFIFGLVLLYYGCASLNQNTLDRKQLKFELWESVNAYWKARQERAFKKMYEFESPVLKGQKSLKTYVAENGRSGGGEDLTRLQTYTIKAIDLSPNGLSGKVKISYSYKIGIPIPFIGGKTVPGAEEIQEWNYAEGKWHFHRKIDPEFHISGR